MLRNIDKAELRYTVHITTLHQTKAHLASCVGTLGLFKSIHEPVLFTHTCSHCCFHEHSRSFLLYVHKQQPVSVSHMVKNVTNVSATYYYIWYFVLSMMF